MTYFLILFAKSSQQENFVHTVAENLTYFSKLEDVKFYFGEESSIFKFESDLILNELSSKIKQLFEKTELAYFLTEYKTDSMAFHLPQHIEKFLMESQVETPSFEFFLQDLNQLEEVNAELDFSIQNLVKELYEMENETKKKLSPSLDEILEKINEVGISGLTKNELNLLNNYSKNI